MKHNSFFSKINVKIAFSFLIMSLTIVFLISIITYSSSSKLILEKISSQTENSIIQTSNYISSYIDKIKTLSDLIAMHPDTKNALQTSNNNAIQSLISMVNLSASNDKRIKSIAVISKDGFAITSDSEMAVTLSNNMMDEPWYKGAVESKQMPVVISANHGGYTMDKENKVVSISHEIVDELGKHLGVVVIDVSYQFIEDYISSLDLGEEGYAYILNFDNQILYNSNEDMLFTENAKQELISLSHCESATLTNSCMVTGINIPHSNWRLVGVSSLENVSILKKQLISSIAFAGLSLIITSIIISVIISKKITKPIIQLQNAMTNVDEKWGHLEIQPHSSFEVANLTKEYNSLLDRIKILTEDIAEKENTRRVFELKALQSQINPHFLYNTLDTILWLAEFGENEKVVEVSKALGELLRLSLNINQTLVPLGFELNHVENYLKIQKMRYEDQINYEISGDENLLDISIPKLILQPIVENAIYHGIRPKKKPGTIKINYEKEKDYLIIQVSDDGVGYKEKENKEQNQSLIKARLSGIGMQNVDQRIKLLCGNDCGIEVDKNYTQGTRIVYKLKINEKDK